MRVDRRPKGLVKVSHVRSSRTQALWWLLKSGVDDDAVDDDGGDVEDGGGPVHVVEADNGGGGGDDEGSYRRCHSLPGASDSRRHRPRHADENRPPGTPDSSQKVKNQYFGDINDFKKYGLLRLLTRGGEINTTVCWMLTLDDDGGDGGSISYLGQAAKWREFDPVLYDHLWDWVFVRKVRDARGAETSAILPNCRFAPGVLSDDAGERSRYFEGCLDIARGCDLVFFDPDNGIAVKSTLYGRKGSCKYLYWHEIERFWESGHSLLIYQHFPRVERGPYVESKARELIRRTGAPQVTSFRTSNVVFLLVPQEDHLDFYRRRCRVVDQTWSEHIQVAYHCS